MKICVFGAGAIGGYLANGLALGGVDVTVIARGDNLAAIRKNGLTVIAEGEARTAKDIAATDDPAEAGPQDYVFITTKAHQTVAAAPAMTALFKPETAIITAQNGLPYWYFHKHGGPFDGQQLKSVDPDGVLWDTIGPERAIGCVVFPAASLTEPGVVKHLGGDKFTLGEPDGSMSSRVAKLSETLIDAGFQAPVRDNIRDDIWKKLWGNVCFNPVSALTLATMDVMATEPGMREICGRMMQESKDVAETLGVGFRISIEDRLDGVAKVGPHKTSMLQDLEAGRALEIDALVTAVQELGRETGIATPTIDTVLALVQQRARASGLY